MTDLRAQFLKSNPFRSRLETVEIPQAEGEPVKLTVKIKQPTVAERNAIFAEAKVSKSGDVNTGTGARIGALAVLHCVRDPATDERVFQDTDLDALLNCPAGGWVDSLAAKAMEVLVDAQEQAKK